jgi:hypothetical protein
MPCDQSDGLHDSRLNEMTSQLNAIQETLGIRVGSTGAEVDSASSTASIYARGTLLSPRPISSDSSENVLPGSAGRSDEPSFYQISQVNDFRAPPVSLGDISLDIDQIRLLFIQ